MEHELFVGADEVAERLNISKPYAYRILKRLNEELKVKGFIVIPGRVSRAYFNEKFYGMQDDRREVI